MEILNVIKSYLKRKNTSYINDKKNSECKERKGRFILMSIISFSIIFTLCTSPCISFASTKNIRQTVDEFCQSFVDAYNVPGMAVSITESDYVVFQGEYGTCTDQTDRFFIGSESKSFTALAIMQLYEKGLLDLDDDVCKYILDLNEKVKINGKTLTIKMLLNQISGFTQFQRPFERNVTKSYGKFVYSNANYDLLGDVIEVVSGESYEDYVTEHIFKPLGMNDSFANSKKAVEAGMLKGHNNYFGFNVEGEGITPTDESWFHESAGYIASTSEDMTKYLQMYLRKGVAEDGTRILSEENIKKMYTDVVPQGRYNSYYGFGFMFYPRDYGDFVDHDGLTEEYRTYLMMVPEENIAVSVLINGEDYLVGNSLTQSICYYLYDILCGQEPATLNNSTYKTKHIVIDFLYLVLIVLSSVYLASTITNIMNRNKSKNIKQKYIIKGVLGIVLMVLILNIPMIIRSTPLWVVRSYVPDLYITIVISAILSGIGTIISLFALFYPKFSAIQKKK